MKKIGLGLIIVLLLTGCSDKLTCTYEVDSEVFSYTTVIEMKFSNDGMKDVEYTNIFEDEETADDWYKILKENENSDAKFELKGKKIIVSDYESDMKNNTKEEVQKYYEGEGYTCK